MLPGKIQKCPKCGKKIKNKGMAGHIRLAHGIDNKAGFGDQCVESRVVDALADNLLERLNGIIKPILKRQIRNFLYPERATRQLDAVSDIMKMATVIAVSKNLSECFSKDFSKIKK